MLDIYSRSILEDIQDAFFAIDTDWHITYLNRQAELLLQKTKAELLGTDLRTIFPRTLNVTLHMLYNQALETLDTIQFDMFFPPQQKWFDIHAYPLRNKLFLYFTDITARKHTEEALHISEQLKQAILDSLNSHIAVLDQRGTIVAVNKGWERYANENDSSPECHCSSVGINYLDACRNVTGEYASYAYEALLGIQRVLQGQLTDFSLEYPCPSPSRMFWYLMNVTAIPLVQGAVVAHIDITERKLAEAALQASALQARRMLGSSIIGTVIADEDYIFQANDTFLTLIGLTQADIAHQPIHWEHITPSEYRDIDHRKVQELMTRGAWSPFEKAYTRKDGSRVPVEIGAVKLQDNPLQWIGFIQDITERKMQEQRKDDFVNIAGHELRTPLTALSGLTQLAKRKLDKQSDPKLIAYLTQMEKQTTAMTKLVNDLLDVSKIQAGRIDYLEENIDIDLLINDIVNTLQQAYTTHTLLIHGEVRKCIVADEDRLKRVFTNLISNAIKYSPQADRIDITVSSSDQMINVRVQDYGVGIPKADQDKIFDRFYRVDGPHKKDISGMGMGLYISREIIDHYGGMITVESTEGKGSSFSVFLPLGTA